MVDSWVVDSWKVRAGCLAAATDRAAATGIPGSTLVLARRRDTDPVVPGPGPATLWRSAQWSGSSTAKIATTGRVAGRSRRFSPAVRPAPPILAGEDPDHWASGWTLAGSLPDPGWTLAGSCRTLAGSRAGSGSACTRAPPAHGWTEEFTPPGRNDVQRPGVCGSRRCHRHSWRWHRSRRPTPGFPATR